MFLTKPIVGWGRDWHRLRRGRAETVGYGAPLEDPAFLGLPVLCVPSMQILTKFGIIDRVIC